MEFQRFHKCPNCKKLIPYLQSRCDCGRRFTGLEEHYKVCPACGSVVDGEALRCSCGFLFIFRRFLDKQNVQEITPEQLAVAYEQGRREGAAEEKARNDAEWDAFFKTAQLKNTVSGGPIRTREDFYKWADEFAAAKAAQRSRFHFLMETDDGDAVSVPGDKLDTFRAAGSRRQNVRYYMELEDGGAVSMTEDQLEEYGRRCNSPRSAEQLERQKRQLLEYLHGKAGDPDA